MTGYPLRLHGILGWRHRGTRMVSPSTVGNTEMAQLVVSDYQVAMIDSGALLDSEKTVS